MSPSLDIEVRELLVKRRGEWKRVAEQSGVSYSWISKFVNGHIPNPGFATLRDLQQHLADPSATAARAGAPQADEDLAPIPPPAQPRVPYDCRSRTGGAHEGAVCLQTSLRIARTGAGELGCEMCPNVAHAVRHEEARSGV